ncbi:MAG: hypothetical protein IJJ33_05375 [Victivallales bacterium]|nr:hypothetical protein [Victivallales bacterium]
MNTPSAADRKFQNYFSAPFERQVMNIEYSVISNYHGKGVLAGNTEMHFRKGIEEGYDGFKADMRFSSDGEIVLCHDPGYTFTQDGKITYFNKENFTSIHDMPFSQIRELEFEHPFEGETLHPCTLDTMLSICEQSDSIAYLTLRPDPWRPEVAKRMAQSLIAHNMQHRTIINLYTGVKEAVTCVSDLLPGLVYCNTRYSSEPLTPELIDSSATDGYQIICLNVCQLETVTPENLERATARNIRIWTWGVKNAEECAANIAHGITGFQMYTRDVNNAVIAELLK